MASLRLTLFTLSLFLIAGLWIGCGDTPVNTTPSSAQEEEPTPYEEPDEEGPRERPDDVNDEIGPPLLVLLTEAEPVVSFSERVDVRVQLVDGTNTPVPEAFITFEPMQGTADTRLSSRNASTDAEGVATTQIVAGIQQVDFDVQVSVFQDDSVEPIQLRVRIQPKNTSDYLVRLSYGGPISLQEAEVTLFESDRRCDGLTESPIESPSSDLAAFSLPPMIPDAEGYFVDYPFNAPRELRFTYAVARGEPRDEGGGGLGYFVTFGCVDSLSAAVPGETTIIEIDMHNLWPETEGTYLISTELNLIDAVPDEYQDTVEAVIEIFENPGLGILKLIAIASHEIGDGSGNYWDDSPWDILLEENASGDIVPTVPAGTIVVALLNSMVELGLNATGDVGTTIREVMDTIADVFTNMQEFTLHGDLVLTANPDAAGDLGEDNRVRYNQIGFVWRGTERTFYLRNGSLIAADGISGAVVFHPHLDETYALALGSMDLDLNYGDILLFVVESFIFPLLTDGEVQSFEDFMGVILDCSDLADRLSCSGQYAPGGAREGDCYDGSLFGLDSAAEAACVSFRDVAAAALMSWIHSLTADLGNYFTLATAADNPCPMGFSSTANDFEVVSLGDSADGAQCVWDARIRFDENDPEGEPMEGTWYGNRL